MKKQYRPKLDPKVDLAGATPEALVQALFRRVEQPTPRPVVDTEPVAKAESLPEPKGNQQTGVQA